MNNAAMNLGLHDLFTLLVFSSLGYKLRNGIASHSEIPFNWVRKFILFFTAAMLLHPHQLHTGFQSLTLTQFQVLSVSWVAGPDALVLAAKSQACVAHFEDVSFPCP